MNKKILRFYIWYEDLVGAYKQCPLLFIITQMLLILCAMYLRFYFS